MKVQIEQHGKQGQIAAKRAFRKTLKWLQGQVITYATKELGILRKSLKQRWFIDLATSTLWIGLNPVAAHRAGKARKTKTGVKVSSYDFEGAFIASMNSNNDLLVMRRVGKHRLPIDKEFVEVDEEITLAFNKFKKLAVARFEVIFKQELNFVRNHEKPK